MLSGELPLLTGSCAVIDLSKNQFEGNLTRLLKWGNVEFLDLSQNHLTGSIPEVTAQFLRLNYLNISHNSLNGSLPKVLTLFPKLTTLDLSFNQHFRNHFSGQLPRNLPDSLQSFNASNNDLSGVVPENLRKFPLSSFYPGNSDLQFPNPPPSSSHGPAGNPKSLSRLDVRSPDRLAGELYFLDDTISFTAEELSRAPAEVLGRSSHGTSYRATLDNDRPGRKGPPLTWAQRLKIAVDVARGLNYLHFDRAVPHGNLKATNILLDGPDFNGRVADYCLHRLMTQSGTIEQILDAGVLGYRKCAGDVVSGADGGVDLTDWVRLRVAEGRGSDCFDAALTPEMSIPVADKGMKEVLGIALRCIRSVSERPGIKTIYEDLSSI
ncbi:UNVERIFIED_CONTAM: LRR receptor-like serine/threonine-protein kinase GHR1 [Sesamum radiatum]|uniref:LRR receptor-like serine/threonine-protein kinase GHR1 n=1 Tax=Sesamum radiatum TaxID=300843 RepID=A0AAW2KG22_SESRA